MTSKGLKSYIQVIGIILIIINSTMRLTFGYQSPRWLSFLIAGLAVAYLYLTFKNSFTNFYLMLKNRSR